MKKDHFKKDNYDFKAQIKERHKLQKILLKKYGKPILVHSTPLKKNFVQILKEGKLKLPLDLDMEKKCPYMEKAMGLDNCIYLSLGFPYATRYRFKYSLIFDLSFLKELEYYNSNPAWKTYKKIVDYIYSESPEYFEKLKEKSKICKEIANRYLYDSVNGKTRNFIDYWRDEKNLFEWIKDYPKQRMIKKIIKETGPSCILKFSSATKHAKEKYMTRDTLEVISRKEIELDSPYFLGFYLVGEIPQDIKKALEKKYKGKILFDGKIIEEIR
jgi:hypothetical protein